MVAGKCPSHEAYDRPVVAVKLYLRVRQAQQEVEDLHPENDASY